MSGGVVHGFNEGFRAEDYAGGVFNKFGTAVRSYPPRDFGIDYYCTLKGISPIAAKIHAKAPHLRPMETSSRGFDFQDGFLRRALVGQQLFDEARNSVSSNGRLMGRLQQATARGVAESPRTRA
jgi:hypothetical protein